MANKGESYFIFEKLNFGVAWPNVNIVFMGLKYLETKKINTAKTTIDIVVKIKNVSKL